MRPRRGTHLQSRWPTRRVWVVRAQADADNSGELSLLEWSRAVKKFPELTSTSSTNMGTVKAKPFDEYLPPMDYFARMDSDGSGQVSKEELSAALQRSNLAPKAVDLIFDKVDTDGSGEISFLEWSRAVRACPELLPEKLGVSQEPNLGDHILNGLTLGLAPKTRR